MRCLPKGMSGLFSTCNPQLSMQSLSPAERHTPPVRTIVPPYAPPVNEIQQARRGGPDLSRTIPAPGENAERGQSTGDGGSVSIIPLETCHAGALDAAGPTGISDTIAPASSSTIRWKSLAFSDG